MNDQHNSIGSDQFRQTDAEIDFSNLSFTKLPSKKLGSSSDTLLNSAKQVEKRTFPSNEVFQFAIELPKRTTNFYCAYAQTPPGENLELYGYVVYVRAKIATRIHKVCVVEEHRGKGIGRWMMNQVLGGLKKGGAREVDLWVDRNREPARNLYLSCGFQEREKVENYYSAGRHGIRMEADMAEYRGAC